MKLWVQASSVAIILVLIINMTLFALGKISQMMLWGIIIISALIAFKIVPRLNKHH